MPTPDSTIDTAELRTLLSQVDALSEEHLWAGLTILAKDAAEFVAMTGTGGEAVTRFLATYADGLDVERAYWQQYGPKLFVGLRDAGLPAGFAAAAQGGHADLQPLTDPAVVHEWTKFPGRTLLRRFAGKLRETICGPDGPYEKFHNGLLQQADLPISIICATLTAGLTPATFWYPLAVYIGLLLTKATLKTYCETGEV
jgi:hypothetical protein